MPAGQKRAWISLDPNFDGGDQYIEKLDGQVDITVRGNATKKKPRLMVWCTQPYVYHVQNAVENDWSGPDRPVQGQHASRLPQCYNVKGGPVV